MILKQEFVILDCDTQIALHLDENQMINNSVKYYNINDHFIKHVVFHKKLN